MRAVDLIVCSTLFLVLSSTGFSEEINCPRSISEKPMVTSGATSWETITTDGSRSLDRVDIYLGNPINHAAQVPDSEKTLHSKEMVTWALPNAGHDTYWAGCAYTGTTAVLAKKLDAKFTTCTASYALLPTGKRLRLSQLTCQ